MRHNTRASAMTQNTRDSAKQKEKRKWVTASESEGGDSRTVKEKKIRKSSQASCTAVNVDIHSKQLVKVSLSKEPVHEPEAHSNTFEIVIFKQVESNPIAIAFQQQLDQLPPPAVRLVVGSGNLAMLPVGFQFVDCLRLGKGATPFDQKISMNCSCTPGKSSCSDAAKCGCLGERGEFAYSRPGILKRGYSSKEGIVECNQGCICDLNCPNRVVQRGRMIPLEVFWLGTKGWGLRCPIKLPRGILIDKYPGEVIGPRESSRRAVLNAKKGTTYLLKLDKFENPRAQYNTIDGEHIGGIARFINHSCNPNLTAYAVLSDRLDAKVYDIAFFTNKALDAGEELTYNYAERLDPEYVAIEDVPEGEKCSCWSEFCRGRII